ncbi:MAG: LptA/OstA family protein [Arenicellales bacterium]
MKSIIFALLLCLPAALWAQDPNGPFSINADKVQVDSRNGVTTYEGNAKVRVLDLLIEAETISIFRKNGAQLPTRIEATGKPLKFSRQASGDKLSGTARKVIFQVPELKLTLIDYTISDPSGNTMKGRQAVFVLDH